MESAVERSSSLLVCLEAVDNDRSDLLEEVTVIEREVGVADREGRDSELYRPANETARERITFTAVPYYA